MANIIFTPSTFNLAKVSRAKDFSRKTRSLTPAGWKRLTAEAFKAHDVIIRRMQRFQKLGNPLLLAVTTRDFHGRQTLCEPITYGCFAGLTKENLILNTGPEHDQKQGISLIYVARIQIVNPLNLAQAFNGIIQPLHGRSTIKELD